MKFKITFWLRKNKINLQGQAPLSGYIRIDSKKSRDFATGIIIHPNNWNSKTQQITGEHLKEQKALALLKENIEEIYKDLQRKGISISPDLVKDSIREHNKNNHTLLKLVSKFINEQTALEGIDKAKDTIRTYNTRYKSILTYLVTIGKKDIFPSEINLKFAREYASYLRIENKCGHNYAMKNIQFLKQMLKYAIHQEELIHNPLQAFEFKMSKAKRIIYLTDIELKVLQSYKFSSVKLQQVADVFIFCCHTGLAFADVSRFNESHISTGIDGEKWIFIERQKTGIDTTLPLLPKAIEILNKYNYSLPVSSNQKMNTYLKEISGILNIDKKLTTHVARKTFGMSMLNEHDICIETVSAMLGHSSIKITQSVYAKIKERKISNDMQKVMKKSA